MGFIARFAYRRAFYGSLSINGSIITGRSFAPIQNLFARVILPLNLDRSYSYFIPDEYVDKIRPGIRRSPVWQKQTVCWYGG